MIMWKTFCFILGKHTCLGFGKVDKFGQCRHVYFLKLEQKVEALCCLAHWCQYALFILNPSCMPHKTNYYSFDDAISVFWISRVHAFVLSCVDLCVVLACFRKLCVFSFYAFFMLFCDCDSFQMWLITLDSIIWSWYQFQLSE